VMEQRAAKALHLLKLQRPASQGNCPGLGGRHHLRGRYV
jgi:hypothetical protein